MKRIPTLLFPLVLASGMAFAANPDLEAGKAKAVVCQACHGTDGNAGVDPQYPRLAGQYADYIAHSLHEYKEGRRTNAIMQGFVATLSDDDITNIAAYFASLPDAKLTNIEGRVQGD